MNILWLIKRWTMGHDVIGERFGRYYHLPVELARRGHTVTVLTLDYRQAGQKRIEHSGVTWLSSGKALSGLPGLLQQAAQIIRTTQPDWILGGTDMHFCILANWLGSRYSTAVAQDIYDDFETFASGRLCRLGRWYYRSLNSSARVFSFHSKLSTYLTDKAPRARHAVVPNGIDPQRFHPRDRESCRTRLNLPAGAPVIGYFGALHPRGMQPLWQAYAEIKRAIPDIHMIIAGHKPPRITITDPSVRYVGVLPQEEVPLYLNACSVVCIVCYKQLRDLGFSLPMKSIEYMACQVPFVAPDIGGLPDEEGVTPAMLYTPNSAADLREKLLLQLRNTQPRFPQQTSWSQAAGIIETELSDTT